MLFIILGVSWSSRENRVCVMMSIENMNVNLHVNVNVNAHVNVKVNVNVNSSLAMFK